MPGKTKEGNRKPGTNVKAKEAHVPPPANPGDIVLVQSKDFLGDDEGKRSSQSRTHPGVVTKHDKEMHIVDIAPIGHKHPGGVPTMPGRDIGLPEAPDKTEDPSLVGLGPPKQILHKDGMPLKPLKEGAKRDPLPAKLTDGHFAHLQDQITIHNPPAPEPEVSGKGKKRAGEKSKRELDLELYVRDFLDGMFDDKW